MASTELLGQNLQLGYIWSARAILGVCNHADIEAITHAIEVYRIGKTILVLHCRSKYDMTASPVNIALTCSNKFWHSKLYRNWTLLLTSFPLMENRRKCTLAADKRGLVAFKAATFSWCCDMPLLENTSKKTFTAWRLRLLFFNPRKSPSSCTEAV